MAPSRTTALNDQQSTGFFYSESEGVLPSWWPTSPEPSSPPQRNDVRLVKRLPRPREGGGGFDAHHTTQQDTHIYPEFIARSVPYLHHSSDATPPRITHRRRRGDGAEAAQAETSAADRDLARRGGPLGKFPKLRSRESVPGPRPRRPSRNNTTTRTARTAIIRTFISLPARNLKLSGLRPVLYHYRGGERPPARAGRPFFSIIIITTTRSAAGQGRQARQGQTDVAGRHERPEGHGEQ